MNQIIYESNTYGDVLMLNELDTYQNQSVKTLGMLRWVDFHFRQSGKSKIPPPPYVLKVDDDVCVKYWTLPKKLPNFAQHGQEGVEFPKRTYYGQVMLNQMVDRTKGNYMYMPEAQYTGLVYPTYVAGSGPYTLTFDTLEPLLQAAKHKFAWIEDTYITGMLGKDINATHEHWGDIIMVQHLCGYKAENQTKEAILDCAQKKAAEWNCLHLALHRELLEDVWKTMEFDKVVAKIE